MTRPIRRPPPPPGPLPPEPPLVSCLTITRARPDALRRALAFFDGQTWPRKELVVVVDRRGDISWVDSFFHDLRRDDVRWDVPPEVEHLGALRNRSLDLARGEFICVWDDDDWYHPLRIEIQARAALAEGVDACFLEDAMHYFTDTEELFLTRWAGLGLPPSMLCRRSSMPRYTEVLDSLRGQKGSDTLLQRELQSSRPTLLLAASAFLYSYVFHGENVWNRHHHIATAFEATPAAPEIQASLPGLRDRLAEYFPVEPPRELVLKDGSRIPLE